MPAGPGGLAGGHAAEGGGNPGSRVRDEILGRQSRRLGGIPQPARYRTVRMASRAGGTAPVPGDRGSGSGAADIRSPPFRDSFEHHGIPSDVRSSRTAWTDRAVSRPVPLIDGRLQHAGGRRRARREPSAGAAARDLLVDRRADPVEGAGPDDPGRATRTGIGRCTRMAATRFRPGIRRSGWTTCLCRRRRRRA